MREYVTVESRPLHAFPVSLATQESLALSPTASERSPTAPSAPWSSPTAFQESRFSGTTLSSLPAAREMPFQYPGPGTHLEGAVS